MGKSTISMAIFNSYFDITRGYLQDDVVAMVLEVTIMVRKLAMTTVRNSEVSELNFLGSCCFTAHV